jgi:hypothetical protein
MVDSGVPRDLGAPTGPPTPSFRSSYLLLVAWSSFLVLASSGNGCCSLLSPHCTGKGATAATAATALAVYSSCSTLSFCPLLLLDLLLSYY